MDHTLKKKKDLLHAPAYCSWNGLPYLFSPSPWSQTNTPNVPQNIFSSRHTLILIVHVLEHAVNSEMNIMLSGCGTWYPAWLARSCGHASSPRVCLARATAAAATWASNRTRLFQLHNGCRSVTNYLILQVRKQGSNGHRNQEIQHQMALPYQ